MIAFNFLIDAVNVTIVLLYIYIYIYSCIIPTQVIHLHIVLFVLIIKNEAIEHRSCYQSSFLFSH